MATMTTVYIRMREVHYELVYAFLTGSRMIERLAALQFIVEVLQYLAFALHPSLTCWSTQLSEQSFLYGTLLPWTSTGVVWTLVAVILALHGMLGLLYYEIAFQGGIQSYRTLNTSRYIIAFFGSIGFLPVLLQLLITLTLDSTTLFQFVSICCMLPGFFAVNCFIYVFWLDPNPLLQSRFHVVSARLSIAALLFKTIIAFLYSFVPASLATSSVLLLVMVLNAAIAILFPKYTHPLTNLVQAAFSGALVWASIISLYVNAQYNQTGIVASTEQVQIMRLGMILFGILFAVLLHVRHLMVLPWSVTWKEELYKNKSSLSSFSEGKMGPTESDTLLFNKLSKNLDENLTRCYFSSDVDYLIRILLLRNTEYFSPLVITILGRALDKRWPKSEWLLMRMLLLLCFLPCIKPHVARKQGRRIIKRLKSLDPQQDTLFVIFYAQRHWQQIETSMQDTGEETELDALSYLTFMNNMKRATSEQAKALKSSIQFWQTAADHGRDRQLLIHYAMIRQRHESNAAWYYQILFKRFPKSVVVLRNYASLIDAIVNNKKHAETLLQVADSLEEEFSHRTDKNRHAQAMLFENIGREEVEINHSPVPIKVEAILENGDMVDQNDPVLDVSVVDEARPISESSRTSNSTNQDDETMNQLDLLGDIYKSSIAARRNGAATKNVARLELGIYLSLGIILLGLFVVFTMGRFIYSTIVISEINLQGTQQCAILAREMELLLATGNVSLEDQRQKMISLAVDLDATIQQTQTSGLLTEKTISDVWYKNQIVPSRIYQPVGLWQTQYGSVGSSMRSFVDAVYALSAEQSFDSVNALQNDTQFRYIVDNAARQEWIGNQMLLADTCDQANADDVKVRQDSIIGMTVGANIIPLLIMLALFLPSIKQVRQDMSLSGKLLSKLSLSIALEQVQRFNTYLPKSSLQQPRNQRDLSRRSSGIFVQGSNVLESHLNPLSPLNSHRPSVSAQSDTSDTTETTLDIHNCDNSDQATDAFSTGATTKIFNLRYISVTFLASMAVLSVLSLLFMTSLLLQNNGSLTDSLKVSLSNKRRVWAVRVNTMASEIIRYDRGTWPTETRDMMREYMKESMDNLLQIHAMLTQGNDTIGLGSVDLDPLAASQHEIVYGMSCDDATNMNCWSMDQVIKYYVREAEAFMLVADQQLSFDIPVYQTMNFLLIQRLLPQLDASLQDFKSTGNPWVVISAYMSNVVIVVALFLMVGMISMLQFPLFTLREHVSAIRNVLFTLPKDYIIQVPTMRDYLYRGHLLTKRQIWKNLRGHGAQGDEQMQEGEELNQQVETEAKEEKAGEDEGLVDKSNNKNVRFGDVLRTNIETMLRHSWSKEGTNTEP